jgi:hypothetical protein
MTKKMQKAGNKEFVIPKEDQMVFIELFGILENTEIILEKTKQDLELVLKNLGQAKETATSEECIHVFRLKMGYIQAITKFISEKIDQLFNTPEVE